MGRLLQLLVAPITRLLGGMRYPVLFGLVAVVFVIDLIVPDIVPFADEILLGLTTLLLASRRKKRPVEDEKADTAKLQAPAVSPDDRALD